MAISLFAQPYDISAQGFYFSNFEEYTEKAEASRNEFGQPVEEYEIQVIDGTDFHKVEEPTQSVLEEWLEYAEQWEDLDSSEQTALKWLVGDIRLDLDEAFSKYQDVIIFDGSATDYAIEFVRDCYDIERKMGSLSNYFDYEAFGRDLVLGGDIVEIGYNTYVTNPHDF